MSMFYGCPFCLHTISWAEKEETKRISDFCLECAVEYRLTPEGKFQWLRYHLVDNDQHFVYLTIDFEKNYTALFDYMVGTKDVQKVLDIPSALNPPHPKDVNRFIDRLHNLLAFS